MQKYLGKCREMTGLLLALLTLQSFAADNDSYEVKITNVIFNFSQLIMNSDSASTEQYLKKEDIQFQFGSLKDYHHYMKSLFRKLNNEGGAISIDQGDTWFSNGRAYAEVTIYTRKSAFMGVFELQRSEEGWLISSVP